MAFIDELARRFGEVVKKVSEKSEELVEIGKLNYEIFKEEDAIKRLYREIGRAVYEAYKQENNSLDAIYRLCQEIDQHREKIEALKKQVESIKKEMPGDEVQERQQQSRAEHASQVDEPSNSRSDVVEETNQGTSGGMAQESNAKAEQ